jgi:hypothetical protein
LREKEKSFVENNYSRGKDILIARLYLGFEGKAA